MSATDIAIIICAVGVAAARIIQAWFDRRAQKAEFAEAKKVIDTTHEIVNSQRTAMETKVTEHEKEITDLKEEIRGLNKIILGTNPKAPPSG